MPLFFQAFVEPLVVEEPLSESYSTTPLSELVMTPMHQLLRDFANDKSQSELLFLLSIALAVSLFAVILPAYESLFGGSCYEDDDGNAIEGKQHELSPYDYVGTGSDGSSGSSSMRMYKPGMGVVEMSVEEIAELTLIRASSGGDCDSSRSSIGSYGSLETIEECEEEYYLEDE